MTVDAGSRLSNCKQILSDLVAFPTVTGTSTVQVAGYVADYLGRYGVVAHLDMAPDGQRANLFATVGPEIDGGVILSGHFDVVPASAAGWTADPFRLTERNGRLHGRGAVDMKGFLAIALAAIPAFAANANRLRRPLHLAFTYDEEIGSFGARQLSPWLARLPFRPAVAIVGEPTEMAPISGHKGGIELIAEITGRSGHASIPANGVNAIYAAARFVGFLEARAAALAAAPWPGSPFTPPYTTISVGRIEGGEARNVIPRFCRFLWEVRPVPEDDADALLAGLFERARTIDARLKSLDPEAGLRIIEEARYPGLAPAQAGDALSVVNRLWAARPPGVVSFGTDGGFIAEADLADGLTFLDRLLEDLCGGGR